MSLSDCIYAKLLCACGSGQQDDIGCRVRSRPEIKLYLCLNASPSKAYRIPRPQSCMTPDYSCVFLYFVAFYICVYIFDTHVLLREKSKLYLGYIYESVLLSSLILASTHASTLVLQATDPSLAPGETPFFSRYRTFTMIVIFQK